MSDPVNPSHYKKPFGDVIDITKHLPFREGNVVKYIMRWQDKGGIEDLKKARWYLSHLIEEVERENS